MAPILQLRTHQLGASQELPKAPKAGRQGSHRCPAGHELPPAWMLNRWTVSLCGLQLQGSRWVEFLCSFANLLNGNLVATTSLKTTLFAPKAVLFAATSLGSVALKRIMNPCQSSRSHPWHVLSVRDLLSCVSKSAVCSTLELECQFLGTFERLNDYDLWLWWLWDYYGPIGYNSLLIA